MYNEERKRRYIDLKEASVTGPPKGLERLFTSTEPFEEKFGKDVCEWVPKEIMEFYKFLDLYSLSSIVVKNSDLSQYTNWALTETLVPDSQNHYLEIRPDMMADCVNKEFLRTLIIPRETFIKSIDKLPNFVDKWMMLAFFEGICGPQYIEMVEARLSDLFDDKIFLRSTGRTLTISSKLRDIARFAAKEEVYYPLGTVVRKLPFDKAEPDDLLFKSVSLSQKRVASQVPSEKAQRAMRRFSNVKKYLDLPPRLTIKNVVLSGKIHMIKEIIKETNLPLEEVITQYRDQINARYTSDLIKIPVEFMRRYATCFD